MSSNWHPWSQCFSAHLNILGIWVTRIRVGSILHSQMAPRCGYVYFRGMIKVFKSLVYILERGYADKIFVLRLSHHFYGGCVLHGKQSNF